MTTSISIIIPVYNAERYIGICANQILQQSYTDFELLLVDDGSTDRSFEICQNIANIDSRVKVIHQENEGVSVARNTGLEQATGDFIAFVDSDDLVATDYLVYLFQLMKNEKTILSMCEHERIYNYDYVFPLPHESFKMVPAQECAQRLLTGRFPISTCGCLFKRALIGDIRFPAGIRNNEDKLFLYQYLLKNETGIVAFSNEKLYGYMVRDGSATRSSWNGSLDIVIVAEQIREKTSVKHPEWDEITRNTCLSARLDVMKSIVQSEKIVHGDKTYDELRREVVSYGWPKNGGHRMKIEYLAAAVGRPAYSALVNIYYKLYSDQKRFKFNEKRTKQ